MWIASRYNMAVLGSLGVLFIIGGIAALMSPFQTFTILASLVGFFLILKGTFDFVIALDVPEAELVDRLLHRAQVEGRADDTREAIEERMHEYHKLTEAVLDYYSRHGVPVKRASGVGRPDEVFERVKRAVSISSV